MKSESVETTLRKLDPQPIATSTVRRLHDWQQSVLDQVDRIEANRSANHPLGNRLHNLATFLPARLAEFSRVDGRTVFVEAGNFHWLLVKLEQRQESMKAQLRPDDPFVPELAPKLRRCIKAGWDAVTWPRGWDRLIDRLNDEMRRRRSERS